ncbi:MAG: cyclic nucleotide-binding domain-containing protein [Rhodospirillales bacterium]|nr:cyclic nucleotide-binding domain-containing protein [Rhodospirillales bacterium]
MQESQVHVAQILRSHPTFKNFTAETIATLTSVAKMEVVPPGEMIVREGEKCSILYLLVSGSASAVRKSAGADPIVLNAIAEGDCIGELAFMDGGQRTASVRAETPCDVLLIPAEALMRTAEGHAAMGDLKSALASVVVRRARAMSDDMLASLRQQLEIKTIQNQFGYFLIFTISIFLISTALFYLVAEHYVKDVYDPGFSWQTILFLAIPCLVVIKTMKIPLADLGIKREGLWSSFRESVAICIVLTIPVGIYLYGFKDPTVVNQSGVTVDIYFLLQYLANSLFQEVGSRGLLQGLFQKFLDDARGHRAIFMTSTVFASLHITFGLDAVIVTFFASFIFGYVYLRQKNLIGVTILHYWLGVLAASLVAF